MNTDRALWRARLIKAIEESGMSDRAISAAAGLSPNYVNHIRRLGKSPGADVLVQICKALNVSLSYIFTGAAISSEEEEILLLYSQLSPQDRQFFLDFLKRLPSAAGH